MVDQTTEPVDPAALSIVNILIHQLSLLMSELLNAGRNTADPAKLSQINNEMLSVQTIMNQAAQAQAAANDAVFGQVTQSLKTQAGMLSGLEAQVTSIVADVASAGRIVGYIGQAISLIGQL
jgi:hypothetical protein